MNVEKGTFCTLLVMMLSGADVMGNSMGVSQKMKIKLHWHLAFSLQDTHVKSFLCNPLLYNYS